MSIFRKLGASLGLVTPPVSGKPGARAYAIGDVHGCIDQLNRLLDAIDRDIAAHPPQPTFVVFLGDLIDRGPDSGGVVDRLMDYVPHGGGRTIFLKGNHEEFLLRALDAEPGLLHQWMEFGGRECVESYGLSASRLSALEDEEASALLRAFVPDAHRRFLDGFIDTFRFGDYVFAHAGIRPGVPLEQQQSSDLRWIREPFLSDRGDHGFVVVHGHTISDGVDLRPNRIGIDTGAYRGGPLTALVLEDSGRRLLQATREGLETAIL